MLFVIIFFGLNPSSIYQGSALSLTNALYSLVDFQTAYQMTSLPIDDFAWTMDKKNPSAYLNPSNFLTAVL